MFLFMYTAARDTRKYDDYLKPYDFQYCKHAKVVSLS